MKSKSIVIIICSILIIIVGIVMSTFITKDKETVKYDSAYDDQINEIIKRMDNKESFNLYLHSHSDGSDIVKVLDYYKDMFSIEYDNVEMKFKNKTFKSLVKKLGINIVDSDQHAYVVITKGVIDYSINGVFSEIDLRRLLITAKKIGKKYDSIDRLVNDTDFKKYYSKDEVYNVLYVLNDDTNLFKYREILCKNKVNSLVVYSGLLDSEETSTMFDNKLGISEGDNKKFPILIKVRKNKIISTKTNVSLDNLAKELK